MASATDVAFISSEMKLGMSRVAPNLLSTGPRRPPAQAARLSDMGLRAFAAPEVASKIASHAQKASYASFTQ